MATATPYGKSPADLWAPLHYMYPRDPAFGSYWRFYEQFVDSYQPPGKYYRVTQGPKNLPQLAALVAPFWTQRKKEDVLDLPSLTYTDAPVIINGKQEALYLRLVKDAYAELIGKEVILENALVKFLRLHQAALDPALLVMSKAIGDGPNENGLGEDIPLVFGKLPAKIEWLRDWLQDHPDEPVVIVSRYRRFVERWLRRLAPDATIVGGMKQDAVQKALRNFNRPSRHGGPGGRLVGTLDAVKEGLNLQRASTMIVMDGTWSSIAEYQLAQRIHRIGSTRPCQVIHLVAKLSSSRKYTVDKILRNAVNKKFSEAELVSAFIADLQRQR